MGPRSYLTLYQNWVCGAYSDTSHREVRVGNAIVSRGLLYDYGPHFLLGVHYKGVVLINNDKYSRTTSKHQNQLENECIRQKVPHTRTKINQDMILEFAPEIRYNKHDWGNIKRHSILVNTIQERLNDLHDYQLINSYNRLYLGMVIDIPNYLINYGSYENNDSYILAKRLT